MNTEQVKEIIKGNLVQTVLDVDQYLATMAVGTWAIIQDNSNTVYIIAKGTGATGNFLQLIGAY